MFAAALCLLIYCVGSRCTACLMQVDCMLRLSESCSVPTQVCTVTASSMRLAVLLPCRPAGFSLVLLPVAAVLFLQFAWPTLAHVVLWSCGSHTCPELPPVQHTYYHFPYLCLQLPQPRPIVSTLACMFLLCHSKDCCTCAHVLEHASCKGHAGLCRHECLRPPLQPTSALPQAFQ